MKTKNIYLFFSILFLGLLTFSPVLALASFDHDLYYGISNSDVTDLQNFLAARGLYAGPITGNYLTLTKQAVIDFQNQEGITPASGYFGVESRDVANILISDGAATTSPLELETGGATTTESLPSAQTISNTETSNTENNNSETDQTNIGTTPANPPEDYSAEIADLASTTDNLTQEFINMDAEVNALQDDLNTLSTSVDTLNDFMTNVQAQMANSQMDETMQQPMMQPTPQTTTQTAPTVTTASVATSTTPATTTTTTTVATSTAATTTRSCKRLHPARSYVTTTGASLPIPR